YLPKLGRKMAVPPESERRCSTGTSAEKRRGVLGFGIQRKKGLGGLKIQRTRKESGRRSISPSSWDRKTYEESTLAIEACAVPSPGQPGDRPPGSNPRPGVSSFAASRRPR